MVFSGLFSSSILTGQGQTKELDIREGDKINDLRDELAWRVIPAFMQERDSPISCMVLAWGPLFHWL